MALQDVEMNHKRPGVGEGLDAIITGRNGPRITRITRIHTNDSWALVEFVSLVVRPSFSGNAIHRELVRLRSGRGTSAICYRCSVPGLAGFAAARLHDFRSLIRGFGF